MVGTVYNCLCSENANKLFFIYEYIKFDKEVLAKLKNYIFGLKNMVGKVNQCVVV